LPEQIVIPERDKWKASHEDRKKVGQSLGRQDKETLEQLQSVYRIKSNFDLKDKALNIETNQYIGSIRLRDVGIDLNIIPKIFKNNTEKLRDTMILLAVANNTKIKCVMEGQKNFFEEDKESHFVDPLHFTLCLRYDELMRQGLLKSYVVHAEDTSSMRGKLLLKHQMLNDAMRRPKFFCEYDELEYDSIENRVILQAMTIVERTSKNPHIKMKSMNYAQRLSGVVQKENVRKPERQRMMHSYNRQNARYRQIHETCETIIERQGIDNIYNGDYSHVIPIFYDMDKEFEKFVERLFEDYYTGEGRVETQSMEQAWQGEDLRDKRMKPDIIIRDGREVKEIIDVKYKTHPVTTPDLYQIGFYMHEYGKYNKNPIDRAFAIMPKYPGEKEGTYTATKTKKMVHVKRIDVNKCVEMFRNDDKNGLRKIVNGLLKLND
jgi:5-methylcytosine-specific restriction endonuclease McrBC regulatory subunit McrC